MAAKPRPDGKMVDAGVRKAFLTAVRECGVVAAAAKHVCVSRYALLRARDLHPDFAEEWDSVVRRLRPAAIDPVKLEKALFNRILYGITRWRLFKGKVADTYRELQDRLGMTFLAMLMPETYGNAAARMVPPVEVMTREEFLAAIDLKPRSTDLPPPSRRTQGRGGAAASRPRSVESAFARRAAARAASPLKGEAERRLHDRIIAAATFRRSIECRADRRARPASP
jgi:hypothetical protein